MINHIKESMRQSVSVAFTDRDQFTEDLVKQWKSNIANTETYDAVDSILNSNKLLFRVDNKEGVEAQILSPKGEVIKTIPPSDVLQLVKQNFIPSLGNLLNVVV